MNAFENLPASLIGSVLKEITGKTYDLHNAESVASAKSEFESLLASPDREMVSRVIDCVVKISEEKEDLLPLPLVELRLVEGPRESELELLEDLPTRARPLHALQDSAQHETVSPTRLGFDPPAFVLPQATPSVEQWEEFLLLAEQNIRNLKPNRKDARKSRYRMTLSYEHVAPNYELIEIQRGSNVAKAHFIFESKCLYFVLNPEENESYRSVATIDEADGFAKDIIEAFNGERDSANLALASIREAISH